jgi:hypothetical protein
MHLRKKRQLFGTAMGLTGGSGSCKTGSDFLKNSKETVAISEERFDKILKNRVSSN